MHPDTSNVPFWWSGALSHVSSRWSSWEAHTDVVILFSTSQEPTKNIRETKRCMNFSVNGLIELSPFMLQVGYDEASSFNPSWLRPSQNQGLHAQGCKHWGLKTTVREEKICSWNWTGEVSEVWAYNSRLWWNKDVSECTRWFLSVILTDVGERFATEPSISGLPCTSEISRLLVNSVIKHFRISWHWTGWGREKLCTWKYT